MIVIEIVRTKDTEAAMSAWIKAYDKSFDESGFGEPYNTSMPGFHEIYKGDLYEHRHFEGYRDEKDIYSGPRYLPDFSPAFKQLVKHVLDHYDRHQRSYLALYNFPPKVLTLPEYNLLIPQFQKEERKLIRKKENYYGSVIGTSNGTSNFSLLDCVRNCHRGLEKAKSLDAAVKIFAVKF